MWGGAVFATQAGQAAGLVYGIPEEANSMLVIDPRDNSFQLNPLPEALAEHGVRKWRGAVLTSAPTRIIGIPYDGDAVLVVSAIRRISKFAMGSLRLVLNGKLVPGR